MIPKKIHYCWFGGNPLPELAQNCIYSWKKYLPDYEIIEWNESNYNVNKIPYISEAYGKRKFAFVSDYARFDILYSYGGIYLDTDVEIIKDLNTLISAGPFMGLEEPGAINSGLGIATRKQEKILEEILDSYNGDHFVNDDGTLNLTTVVTRVSNIFRKYGFTNENIIQNIKGINIYPVEYLCPKNMRTSIVNITDNSYTIHHYDGSWVEPWEKKAKTFYAKLQNKFGSGLITKLIFVPYFFIIRVIKLGFKRTIREIKNGRKK